MTDLGWKADGIERAMAAGGVPLERYRRPGFTGGPAIRRSTEGGAGGGFPADYESWGSAPDPDPQLKRRRKP